MKTCRPYLLHILQEIDYLLMQSSGLGFEAFAQDETRKRAFVRSLEIIGEAVKNIPDAIKQKYPDVGWRKIAGMRDKLIQAHFNLKRNALGQDSARVAGWDLSLLPQSMIKDGIRRWLSPPHAPRV